MLHMVLYMVSVEICTFHSIGTGIRIPPCLDFDNMYLRTEEPINCRERLRRVGFSWQHSRLLFVEKGRTG